MRDIIAILESKSKSGDIEPVQLGYNDGALAPVLSAASIKQHHKLWAGYCDRFNKGEGDSQFNYAGAILHNIYFTQFRSPRTNNQPNGPIGGMIMGKYKSWDAFTEAFEDVALKFQGSGWIYLARDGSIKTIANHALRSDIVLLVDWWEHAYLPDYGSDKRRYLQKTWSIIDWNKINTQYMAPYRT